MDYSKYALYKSKGMITMDNSKIISVYTLQQYNPDTGALELKESAELTKATVADLKASLEAEKAKIQAQIDGLTEIEKDIL